MNAGFPALKEGDINFGDLVWGRVTGYPWWPAKIALHEKSELWKKNGRFWVSFFNDDHGAWLPLKGMLPWNDDVKTQCISATKKYRDRVRKAVAQAEEHGQLIRTYSEPIRQLGAPAVTANGELLGGAPAPGDPREPQGEHVLYKGASTSKRKKPVVSAFDDQYHFRSESSAPLINGYLRFSASMSMCHERMLARQQPRAPAKRLDESLERVEERPTLGTTSGDEQSSTGGIDLRGLGSLPQHPPHFSSDRETTHIAASRVLEGDMQDVQEDENLAVHGQRGGSGSAVLLNSGIKEEMHNEDTETESETRKVPAESTFKVELSRSEWERLVRHISTLESKVGELETEVNTLRSKGAAAQTGASSMPSNSSPASASFNTILRMFGDPESAALRASLEALQTSAHCFLEGKRSNGSLDSLRAELERIVPESPNNFLFQSITAALLYHQPNQTMNVKDRARSQVRKQQAGSGRMSKKTAINPETAPNRRQSTPKTQETDRRGKVSKGVPHASIHVPAAATKPAATVRKRPRREDEKVKATKRSRQGGAEPINSKPAGSRTKGPVTIAKGRSRSRRRAA